MAGDPLIPMDGREGECRAKLSENRRRELSVFLEKRRTSNRTNRENCWIKVLISVAYGIEYYKNGVIIFTGQEKVDCPNCGGGLQVRNTCHRKLRTHQGTRVYRLRVMKCTKCGKSHRELPQWIVPYKRMDAASLVNLAQTPRKTHLHQASTNTWKRVRRWMAWFLRYTRKRFGKAPAALPKLKLQKFLSLVQRAVNIGGWVQHRLGQSKS